MLQTTSTMLFASISCLVSFSIYIHHLVVLASGKNTSYSCRIYWFCLISEILGLSFSYPHYFCMSLSSMRVEVTKPKVAKVKDTNVLFLKQDISRTICEASLNSLLALASNTWTRAFARSTFIPHVGHWLNVITSSALGLYIQHPKFLFCLQYGLGIPLLASDSQCCPSGLRVVKLSCLLHLNLYCKGLLFKMLFLPSVKNCC